MCLKRSRSPTAAASGFAVSSRHRRTLWIDTFWETMKAWASSQALRLVFSPQPRALPPSEIVLSPHITTVPQYLGCAWQSTVTSRVPAQCYRVVVHFGLMGPGLLEFWGLGVLGCSFTSWGPTVHQRHSEVYWGALASMGFGFFVSHFVCIVLWGDSDT